MTFRSELGREVFDLNESLLEGKFVLENANVGGNVIKHLPYTFFIVTFYGFFSDTLSLQVHMAHTVCCIQYYYVHRVCIPIIGKGAM